MSEFIFSRQNENIISPLEAGRNPALDVSSHLARAAVTLARIKQIHEKAGAGDTIDVVLPSDLISSDIDAAGLRTDISSLGIHGSPLALSVTETGDQLTASFQCVKLNTPS